MNRRPALRCSSLAALLALMAGIPCIGAAEEVRVPGGVIEVRLTREVAPPLRKLAIDWVESAARAVAGYYGEYPVRRASVRITPGDGHGAKHGKAFGWDGPFITVSLGRDSTPADLADDWLLTHEMLHLGFSSLSERNHWLEEGISTYVEPIARARAGQLTPERAWGDLVDGLPQGLPESGDRGLDVTHTWGRTYWGGALFCLRADVEIRKRTDNRKGFEDALRAIVAAGGSIEVDWKIDRVIEVGDRATGVPVLRELYDEMKAQPIAVDLEKLWQQLGIEQKGRKIVFNENAPLAQVRAAITQPIPGKR